MLKKISISFLCIIIGVLNIFCQTMPILNSNCGDCQLNNSFFDEPQIQFEGGSICCDRNFRLVFSDEFDGTEVDTSKWNTCYLYNDRDRTSTYEGAPNRVHENGGSYYKDENVTVSGGICRLLTKIDPTSFPEVCFGSGKCTNYKSFSSGMLMTKRWFENYHRYEIRCKVPSGSDMWPAFWVFGWHTEIDVFEFVNSVEPEFSVHKWEGNAPKYTHNSGQCDFGNLQDDFHTYAVEHDKYFIRWYIDDVLVFSSSHFKHLNNVRNFNCELDEDTYIRNRAFPECNEPALQVIASSGADPKAPMFKFNPWKGIYEVNDRFPNDMLIDYIRVYELVDNSNNEGCNIKIKGPTSICERIDTLEYCLEGGKMIGGNWELPIGIKMYQDPSLTITKKIVIVNGEEVIQYDTIKNENCIKVIANGYYGNNSIKYKVPEECKFLSGDVIEKTITFGPPASPKVNITRNGCTSVTLCVEKPELYTSLWFSGTTPVIGNCQTIPVEFSYKFPYTYIFVEVSNECGKYLHAIKIDGRNCLGLPADDKIGFEITPNPAQDEINIKIDQNIISDSESNFVECQILSLNTGTIMSKINISQQNEIYVNTSNYSTGEYLVLLKNLQGSFISDKLVINRF